jgi:hypothetical protein
MLDQDLAPVAVAQRHQAFGGTGDVGEQDGSQDPFPLGALPQTCTGIKVLATA